MTQHLPDSTGCMLMASSAGKCRLLAAMLGLLALATLTGCGADKPRSAAPAVAVQDPMEVLAGEALQGRLRLEDVSWAEVREQLRVPGRIEVDETRFAKVGASVTGRIVELGANVGQSVRRGAVLATISSTELAGTQLAYLKALSQRQLAERAAVRAEQLLDAEVIGGAELQRRQAESQQAQAEVSAASDQLRVLGMSVEAIAQLTRTRTVNSMSQVVSSIQGTVIERKVTQGQVVQPADSIFLIADLSTLWVVADIPEQRAGAVRVGEMVEADVAALPGRRIRGRLSFVGVTVDPETRTVRARMDVANPDMDLKPAMLATVLIRSESQRQQVIPAAAVVREENRDHVFVQIAPGRYRLRPVSLGAEVDGRRVVLGGLLEAEKIVGEGSFHLNNERKQRATQSGSAVKGSAGNG